MRSSFFGVVQTLLAATAAIMPSCPPTLALGTRPTHDTHDFFALHLDSRVSPESIASLLGACYGGPIGELSGHYKFSATKGDGATLGALLQRLQTRRRRRALDRERDYNGSIGLDGILWSQRLNRKDPLQRREAPPLMHIDTSKWVVDTDAVHAQQQLMSALDITDPGFSQQWHLFNTIQLSQDMNVTGVWLEGLTGKGVVTAIIDNGLDTSSADLVDNYFGPGSYDFNEQKADPSPGDSSETHGTRCAGEVAAGKNGICGIGMAYESKVAGIRLLSGPIDESDEAAALTYRFHDNHIYSCSWGPPDNGGSMGGPGPLFRRAFMYGVQNGRHGKGSIYVFAAGNGGYLGDNCNFDGYTNSIYTITVGAATREGRHAEYTEPCAAQLAVAYSSAAYKSRGLDAIYTTDVGAHACTHAHGGTSAAGPLAAGAVALAMSVRPGLTWRDVQYLIQATAVAIDEHSGSDWQVTSTGKFSHLYGFGKIDTYALVQRAKTWQLVKPQAWYHSPWQRVDEAVPQGSLGVSRTLAVTAETLQAANLARLEHVTVTMNVDHTRRGDLSVELHSPEGMISYLSTSRIHDNVAAGYEDWTFSSVAHWGEAGLGTWKILVQDTQVNDHSGKFIDWRLNLWGEAIDETSQSQHPLPGADDDEDGSFLEAATEPSFIPPTYVDRPVIADGLPALSTPPSRQGPSLAASRTSSEPWWIWAYGTLLLLVSFYVVAATSVQFVRWYQRRRVLHYQVPLRDLSEARDRRMCRNDGADGEAQCASENGGGKEGLNFAVKRDGMV